MPAAQDFRSVAGFDAKSIDDAGRHIGRNVYWRLYAVENLMRVIIHSVLHAQIGSTWWGVAVDQNLQKKAERFRTNYTKKPWHSSPGSHHIYYIDLLDLNEIVRVNSNLFLPIIPDVDQWMARIEQLRLPRNVVAHMNWPHETDRQRIQVFYQDLQALCSQVAERVTLSVP